MTTTHSMEWCESVVIRDLFSSFSYSSDNTVVKYAYLVKKTCTLDMRTQSSYNHYTAQYNTSSWQDTIKSYCKSIIERKQFQIIQYLDVPCLLDYYFDRLCANGQLSSKQSKSDSLSIKRAFNNDVQVDKANYDELVKLSYLHNFTIEQCQQVLDICRYFNKRSGNSLLSPVSVLKQYCPAMFEQSSFGGKRPNVEDSESKQWIDLYKLFNVVDDNITSEDLRKIILDPYKDNQNYKPKPISCIIDSRRVLYFDIDTIEKHVESNTKGYSFKNDYNQHTYPNEANYKLHNLSFKKLMKLADKHITLHKKNVKIDNCYYKLKLDKLQSTLWYHVKDLKDDDYVILTLPIHELNDGPCYSRFITKQPETKTKLRVDDSAKSSRKKSTTTQACTNHDEISEVDSSNYIANYNEYSGVFDASDNQE